MFYIMSADDRIIEQYTSPPTMDDLKKLADECCLHELWVIDGEHSGMTWTRETPAAPTPKPRLVFGQPIPDELLPDAPQAKPLPLWKD